MQPESQLPEATSPEFKDRRAGLICFGVLEILLGALCVLFIPLMLFGQAMAAKTSGGETQYRMILPAVAVYGVMAALFVALGTGSIRGRRWARALSLILAWSWLAVGVVGTAVYAVILPKIFGASGAAPGVPESARMAIIVVALTFMAVILIALPAALVVFYQSKHVKATCEARDPVVRWTDRCPLPVLALSLWLLYGGVCMLLMPVAYHGVVPFFGVLLSGAPGMAFCFVQAALWVYLARAVYRLKPEGWWILLVALVVIGVSSLITFARVDLIEMYRLMGYPEAQIELIRRYQFLQSSGMVWCVALGFGALLAYLCYVKKFFGPAQPGKTGL